MVNVACVLRSGGVYDAEWARKLRDGVERHLTLPHRFLCLSDVEVPCERIPLEHNWPGWWSKIELFNGKLPTPCLYLDLDTIITGSLDELFKCPYDFAMLRNFNNPEMVGSGVMWFNKVPTKVYEKFIKQPEAYIAHHKRVENGSYCGDQAFVWDALGRKVDLITDSFNNIKSYKRHCRKALPKDTSIVCFHGHPRPCSVSDEWVKENWT